MMSKVNKKSSILQQHKKNTADFFLLREPDFLFNKIDIKVGCYELLIPDQQTQLPMHHYSVITSAQRSNYINKHSNFCPEK